MKWCADDYQMPACFFEAVGVYCRRRNLDIPMARYWWGHRFLDDREASGRPDAELPPDLTGILGDNNPYRGVADMPLYQSMFDYVPLSITVDRIDDVGAYVALVISKLDLDDWVVIPFPLCRKTGLRDMIEPSPHFTLAWKLESGRVSLMDQHNNAALPIAEFERRLHWFFEYHRFLPFYQIARAADWSVAVTANPFNDYRASLAEYRASGRGVLDRYVSASLALAREGREQQLPAGSLWKVAQCRLAEAQYLGAIGESPFSALLPLVTDLARRWNDAAARAKYNSLLPPARFVGISPQLPSLLRLEDQYFEQIEKILETTTVIPEPQRR